jgi:hypothetical protein
MVRGEQSSPAPHAIRKRSITDVAPGEFQLAQHRTRSLEYLARRSHQSARRSVASSEGIDGVAAGAVADASAEFHHDNRG